MASAYFEENSHMSLVGKSEVVYSAPTLFPFVDVFFAHRDTERI